MTDEKPEPPKELPKRLKVPITQSLPAYLKDPKNYNKINKFILESLASKHSHGEVIDWAKCASCQRRFAERSIVLKKLGFQSPAQYRAWHRVHAKIKGMLGKDILPKYND